MIAALRALALRLWPVPRLRWLLFGTLLFVAALPGIAALGLRVYENALIRQTEAELTLETRDEEHSQTVIRALVTAGYTVERQLDLRSREVSQNALEAGAIDVKPEYLSSLLVFPDPNAEAARHPPEGPLASDQGAAAGRPARTGAAPGDRVGGGDDPLAGGGRADRGTRCRGVAAPRPGAPWGDKTIDRRGRAQGAG